MHCTNCGTTLPDQSTHCPDCGQPAETHPATSSTYSADANPQAPSATAQVFCVECGAAVEPQAAFCPECGTARAQTVSPADEARSEAANQNDRLTAALCYPIPLVSIVVLLSQESRMHPFQRYHAVQSLVFWVVLTLIAIVLVVVTLGFGALCLPVLWLVALWPAYQAYRGRYLEMPVITSFIRKQKWV